MNEILDIFLDSLKDSAIVFAVVFVVHLILAFFEEKITDFLVHRKKSATFFASLFGLVPQCGTSILGADLYIKRYITIGTVIAIFLSCSDEAFIVLLTSWNEKTIMILPLIGLKFVIGFVSGVLIDLIFKKDNQELETYHEDHLCHQHHEENTKVHKYLVHPLFHSLEIFAYVLIINFVLGLIIFAIGENNFSNFITSNRFLTPLYATLVGLIPNCSSSILITTLFVEGNLSFGAMLSGLLVNSGLGITVLVKNKHHFKNTLIILGICFVIALTSGYITCLIAGF